MCPSTANTSRHIPLLFAFGEDPRGRGFTRQPKWFNSWLHLLSPSIPLLALRAFFSKNLQYFPTPWQVHLAQFQKADPTAQARMGICSLSSFCKPGFTTRPLPKGHLRFWAGQGSPVWDLLFLHTCFVPEQWKSVTPACHFAPLLCLWFCTEIARGTSSCQAPD